MEFREKPLTLPVKYSTSRGGTTVFALIGKVALVTGGGSGIGAAIATLFARQGAHVVILDVDLDAARTVAASITAGGGLADARLCDVADAASVGAAIAATAAAHRRIDILVNNAGIAHVGTVERTEEADMDRLFRVNVKGVYLCARAVVPIMIAQGGGVILNMASITSLIGVPERFAYSMSKGAVLTMTMSLAVDYLKHQHPLQLHLSGAHPHAVCRSIRRASLRRPRGGDPARARRLPADWPDGNARRSRGTGALSVFR